MYLEHNGKESNDVNANNGVNTNVTISRYTNGNSNGVNGYDTEKIITEKVKIEIDRLKEKMEELDQISK